MRGLWGESRRRWCKEEDQQEDCEPDGRMRCEETWIKPGGNCHRGPGPWPLEQDRGGLMRQQRRGMLSQVSREPSFTTDTYLKSVPCNFFMYSSKILFSWFFILTRNYLSVVGNKRISGKAFETEYWFKSSNFCLSLHIFCALRKVTASDLFSQNHLNKTLTFSKGTYSALKVAFLPLIDQ